MATRATSQGDSLPADALIIGAGPFGLALSARLHALGVHHRIIGSTMSFWKNHMPAGMFLRSSWDWHLDPQGWWTIERFLELRGLTKADITPLPIGRYLEYVEWFRRGAGIEPEDTVAIKIDQDKSGQFLVQTGQGEMISARNVVVALGFSSFAMTPPELSNLLPNGNVRHTLEATDFSAASGRRFLIVGGRQSAFEWAALLAESGARRVDMVHRHPSPAFAEADWTWVPPLMDSMVENPAWFRSLSIEDRQSYGSRLWGEGRLKVEPWLETRIAAGPVSIHPETTIAGSRVGNGGVVVQLSTGEVIVVDEIILATGYKPDLSRIDLLTHGNVGRMIQTDDGLPMLDTGFQTTAPGLYVTSLLASRDFGPFFGFTVAARAAARVLGDHLARRLD